MVIVRMVIIPEMIITSKPSFMVVVEMVLLQY
jgi:hypothetical protein